MTRGSLPLQDRSIAIIGGCGRVGLPLGVKLALAGARTSLVDINESAVKQVNAGTLPFLEEGGSEALTRALEMGLQATGDPNACADAEILVFVTGTPVDEHLNPMLSHVLGIFDEYHRFLSPSKLVIMRSTVFPGTMEHLNERLSLAFPGIRLAFCPERVAQGHALKEIDSLPQIVAAFEEEAFRDAAEIFGALAPAVVKLTPIEAELTKVMANSWRYLEFAITNQFFLIAASRGVDFHRIYKAIRYEYPRAAGYKSPGFTAGPCLFKDTMQLASYADSSFYLGHAAMLVNEGMATFASQKVVEELGGRLWGKTVGLLGMAFKKDSDDVRDSLSFKVKKLLELAGARVLCTDPFLPDLAPLEEVVEKSDALVLCAPHSAYASLEVRVPLVDVWGILKDPELEVWPSGRNTP